MYSYWLLPRTAENSHGLRSANTFRVIPGHSSANIDRPASRMVLHGFISVALLSNTVIINILNQEEKLTLCGLDGERVTETFDMKNVLPKSLMHTRD